MNVKKKILAFLSVALVVTVLITPTGYFGNNGAYAATLFDRESQAKSVYLIAQGHSTYENIYSLFGDDNLQSPDCGHDEFGPHITQEWDHYLGKYAFVFHIHVEEDSDQCLRFDRQRNEIKVSKSSPENLKGFWGDTVSYKWLFKLDDSFQPSRNFTHIHQIKPFPSNDLGPTITITPVSGNIDTLEIRHRDSSRERHTISSAPLDLFTGEWIEVSERLTYRTNGKYKIELRHMESGRLLLKHKDSDIDLWAEGIQFQRPKWGVYRSLNRKEALRDEQVRFDQICMVKGRKICS